jgi:hypothetical protein
LGSRQSGIEDKEVGLEVQDKEIGLEVQDKKEGLDIQTNKFVTKWLGTFCKIIMRPDLAYSSSDFHTSLALSQKKKNKKDNLSKEIMADKVVRKSFNQDISLM